MALAWVFSVDKIPDRFSPVRKILNRATVDGLLGQYLLNPISGTAFDDQIYLTVARSSTAVFDAGAGNDTIFGNINAQYINGGKGDDVINGGGGIDNLNGGEGIDTLSFRPNGGSDPYSAGVVVDIALGRYTSAGKTSVALGFENVFGSSGKDNINGSSLNNIIIAGDGADTVFGQAGDDSLDGGAGNDVLNGGIGNDQFIGGAGNDLIYGDAGIDTADYSYLLANQSLNVALNGSLLVKATVSGPGAETDWVRDVEYLVAGGGNDNVSGDYQDNKLWGLAGNDILNGGGGNDVIDGGDDNDTIDGGTGNDTLFGGQGADLIAGGSGNDWIDGGADNDRLFGGTGSDEIFGGDGADYIDAGDDDDAAYGGAGADEIRGGAGADSLSGQEGDDRLYGGTGNDKIYGGDGVDYVDAGDNDDQVEGGNGNDEIWGGAGADVLYGQDGEDWVSGGRGNDRLYGGLMRDVLKSGDGNDYLNGGDASDWVNFQPNTDGETPTQLTIDLQASSTPGTGTYSFTGLTSSGSGTLESIENVLGSRGNDTITGSADINDLRGAAGDDVIRAEGGDDRLVGGAGYDQLEGDAGADTLFGGAGSYSRLNGSLKGNLSKGGDGADTFMVGYSLADELLNQAPVPSVLSLTTPTATSGTDLLVDWDRTVDSLSVSAQGVAIIAGLAGQANWSGNDTVDLRNRVTNSGVIVAMTGAGDDVIYGSSGVDYIYGNSGFNTIDISNGGADRIYIDTMLGRYNVAGFGADDRIYINQNAIAPFATAGFTITGSSVNDDRSGASVTSGVSRSASGLGINFSDIYNPVYDQFLANNVPNYPLMSGDFGFAGVSFGHSDAAWRSNGVYSNDAHTFAQRAANTSLTAAGSAMLATAYALSAIPFVGPFLAIPLYTIGGAVLDLGILGGWGSNIDSTPHQNAEYRGDSLNGHFNLITAGKTLSSTAGSWDNLAFTSFYNNAYDGFSPALQITNQAYRGELSNSPLAINSLVAVYSDTETFVYLVTSEDNIIQDSESKLVAQFNGHVAASQIVMYDPDQDIYNSGDGALPIFAPASTLSIGVSAGKQSFAVGQTIVTDDNAPSITISLANSSTPNDPTTVQIYDGATLLQTYNMIPGGAVTFTGSLNAAAPTAYRVVTTSSQGFISETSAPVKLDLDAPKVTGLSASPDGIAINSSESGYAGLYTSGGTLIGSTTTTRAYMDSQSIVQVAAQVEVTTTTLKVSDIFGLDNSIHTKTVSAIESEASGGTPPPDIPIEIILGSNAGNTISVSTSTISYQGSSIDTIGLVYGFGGDDVLTGRSNVDYLLGGDGDDTLDGSTGADYLYGGNGADTIYGGYGADNIYLEEATASIDEVVVMRGAGAIPSPIGDSLPSIDASSTSIPRTSVSGFDTVSGFDLTLDKIVTPNAVLAADTLSAVNGVDYIGDNQSIKAHRVSNGVIQFDEQDADLSLFAPLDIFGGAYVAAEVEAYNLDEVVGYLRQNLADDESVAFNVGTDAFLYTHSAAVSDRPETTGVDETAYRAESLVKIQGVSVVALTLDVPTGAFTLA